MPVFVYEKKKRQLLAEDPFMNSPGKKSEEFQAVTAFAWF